MKKLFLIKDSLANQISYYHLILLLASLPFDIFYSHIILISFALHTVIQFKKEHIKQVSIAKIILLQSVFIVTAISTIYSTNIPEAFNEWLKQLTIVVLPILFYFNGLDIRKYRQQLLSVFSAVCTLTIVYLYYDGIRIIRYYHLPYKTIFSPSFTNHNFSDPIGIHATYFAMQVAVALIFIISQLIKKSAGWYLWLYSACILILSAGLVQLSSKSVCMVVFFAAIVLIPWFLRKAIMLKYITIATTCSLLIVAAIFTSGTFRERFFTELKYDLTPLQKPQTSEPRIARWGMATELIAQSTVIGHGAGTEITLLHEKFYVKKYYNSFINHLNSHNQYLSFLIKSGFIGLLVYLVTLWFGFKEALQNKDLLFCTFMLLIATVSISENLLDVDKGIFFYAVFFSLFLFSNGTKKLPEMSHILIAEGNQVLV